MVLIVDPGLSIPAASAFCPYIQRDPRFRTSRPLPPASRPIAIPPCPHLQAARLCDLHHHHTHPPRAYESTYVVQRGTYLQPDLDVLRPSPSQWHRRTKAPTLVKPTDALSACALPDLLALPCLASPLPTHCLAHRPLELSLDTGRPGRIAGKTLAPRVVIVVRCRHPSSSSRAAHLLHISPRSITENRLEQTSSRPDRPALNSLPVHDLGQLTAPVSPSASRVSSSGSP